MELITLGARRLILRERESAREGGARDITRNSALYALARARAAPEASSIIAVAALAAYIARVKVNRGALAILSHLGMCMHDFTAPR